MYEIIPQKITDFYYHFQLFFVCFSVIFRHIFMRFVWSSTRITYKKKFLKRSKKFVLRVFSEVDGNMKQKKILPWASK